MTPTTFLSDTEIAEITEPLRQAAAQCRYLKKLGLKVQQKPNGAPLVMRSNVEAVLGSAPVGKMAANEEKNQPDRDGFVTYLNRHRMP